MEKKIDIYNRKIEFNNMIYSIDMIRLKTFITYEVYNSIDFYFRTYFKDKIKRFWISDRVQCFKYNWNIEIEEGKSFWFGFCHNTEQKLSERFEPTYNFTIEFNPNKLRGDKLIMYLLGISGIWYLVRYDLAIDLRVNILDLILDKSGKKRKVVCYSNGFDDKTYTIGSSGDKHIKIYNKKKEANLNILGDLTRIEITKECDSFKVNDIVMFNYDEEFPVIYLNRYVYSFSDYIGKTEVDKTTYAVLYAVQNGYPMSDLSRVYRKKIKDMLEGGYQIKFDRQSANQALKQTIYFYFMGNPRFIFS